MPVVAVLAGLLFATTSQVARGTNLRAEVTDVSQLIRAEDARNAERTARVGELRAEVDALSQDRGGSTRAKEDTARADRLAPAAGYAPVTGDALRVTLDDADITADALPEGVSVDDVVVHQQDVQAVVNALWRGGATGITVMDQRIISTSAVRCVGNTLILQGRVYSPPFTVTATGDPATLEAELSADPQVQIYLQYVEKVGLGWLVERQGRITLPAYDGSSTLRHARPER